MHYAIFYRRIRLLLENLAKKSVFLYLIFLTVGIDLLAHEKRENNSFNRELKGTILNKEKRLLIVGMSESPHLHTWIDGLGISDVAKQVWLFPSDLPVKRYKNQNILVNEFPNTSIGFHTKLAFKILDILTRKNWRSYFLYREIKKIKPTHLHFHETQHGAYIYNTIASHPKNEFNGKIILSTWGSDLIYYGNFEEHITKLKRVFSWVDLLTAERVQEFEIANKFGFRGKFEAPIYTTIGNRNSHTNLQKTSDRKVILIKGYQDKHGRALNALAAIEKLSKEADLSGYNFKVFSASKPVKKRVKLMKKDLRINIEVLQKSSKSLFIKNYADARAYLGLAISDGLSTSMVEAMSFGAFPIQSINSSAPDFLQDGKTGGVVDPFDVEGVAKILRKALFDDELVDNAAIANLLVLNKNYNWEMGIKKLVQIYD